MTTTALPPRMARNAPQPAIATDRQVNYVRKLMDERDGTTVNAEFRATVEAEIAAGISGAAISAIITLLTTPEMRPPRGGNRAERVELEAGMYRKGDTFYRVKVSKAGNWYAQELRINDDTGRIDFRYVGKVYGLVAEHRLAQDEARAFGVETGNCICCGAVLTNPDSIAAGIGPICAGKV